MTRLAKKRILLLFTFGRKYHNHLAPFKFRELLDLCDFSEVFTNAREHVLTQILMRHFAAAVAKRHFGARSFVW